MNFEEIKKKIKAIGSSTGTKHPKTLITELCSVVDALVEEIERIQAPPTQSAQQILEERMSKPQDPPWLDQPPKYSPYFPEPDSKTRKRMGNAGDAE